MTPNNYPVYSSKISFYISLQDNFLNQLISQRTRCREGQRAEILDLLIADKSEIVTKVFFTAQIWVQVKVTMFAL